VNTNMRGRAMGESNLAQGPKGKCSEWSGMETPAGV